MHCNRAIFRQTGLRQHPEDKALTFTAAVLSISSHMASPSLPLNQQWEYFEKGPPACLSQICVVGVITYLQLFPEKTPFNCLNRYFKVNKYKGRSETMIWVVITEHQWRSPIFNYLSVENKEPIVNASAPKTVRLSKWHRTAWMVSTLGLGWGFETCNQATDKGTGWV